MRCTALALAGLILLAGCSSGPDSSSSSNGIAPLSDEAAAYVPTKIDFVSDDGFGLKGLLFEPENPNGRAIVLAHMMDSDKSAWDPLARRLWADGFYVLAFDLRGQGESTVAPDGSEVSLAKGNVSFSRYPDDVRAARNELNRLCSRVQSIYLGGASIGANAALLAASGDNQVPGVLLISPGLDYQGLKTEIPAQRVNGRVLVLVDPLDSISADSTQPLMAALGSKATLKSISGGGHGTQIFLNRPESIEIIQSWLGARLS